MADFIGSTISSLVSLVAINKGLSEAVGDPSSDFVQMIKEELKKKSTTKMRDSYLKYSRALYNQIQHSAAGILSYSYENDLTEENIQKLVGAYLEGGSINFGTSTYIFRKIDDDKNKYRQQN